MAQVKYQFIADWGISINELVFEHIAEADPSKNTDTMEVVITGSLDIDFSCEGMKNNQEGDRWHLYVWVNNKPIQTPAMTGCIYGTLNKHKKASFTGSFNW